MAGRVGVGHGEDDDQVGDRAVADEALGAIEDVGLATARARAVVRSAAASEPASASVRAKAMSCSPLARRGNQRACCSAVPARVMGSEPSSWTARMSPVVAHARRQLLDGQAHRQQLATEAAVLLGERQGQDVVVGQQPAQVLGELAGPVDLGRARRDALVGQHADGVAEHLVLLAQAVGARGAIRGGHRAHRTPRAVGVVPGRTGGRTLGRRPGARRGGRVRDHGRDRRCQKRPSDCSPSSARQRSASWPRSASCVVSATSRGGGRENPFATATEGMKRCPKCGLANLVTDRTCNSCGKRLPG